MAMIARLLLRVLCLPFLVWGSAALWFDGPASRGLAGALAGGYVLLSLALLWHRPTRPGARKLALVALLFAGLVGWWLSIPARNDRVWLEDVAKLPSARFDGDVVTLTNVRDFAYRSETDFDARWETRRYDLSQIRGIDLFLCYWGPREIAHTIMSWEFADGQHLAISIETRKELGEEYSALRGFFRQFELYYVVADERDVIRVRSEQRGEEVFLYRLAAPPERARALLEQYLRRVDGLNDSPAWYNAFSKNCTTVIFDHVRPIMGEIPFDMRMLINGRIDELLYDRGSINTSLTFEQLRAASEVTQTAHAAGDAADFSARIRAELPGRPAPPKD
ncbi:MAG: hypothetical protein DRQ55_01470 [Planctomycetota bacterium]|nr:MAG: hypothetical protein DRQ55_01470 [Planctomycetota bacterium]